MVFEEFDNSSIFENDDEFGVDAFRQDMRHVINANLVKVKLIKHNDKQDDVVQGDFLGITTNDFEDEPCLIKINIMSQNPDEQTQKRDGFHARGDVTFSCFASHDLDIDNRDLVEFIDDYGYQISAGDRFRVKLEDRGLYQGQYTYVSFTITKI